VRDALDVSAGDQLSFLINADGTARVQENTGNLPAMR
jgi:hypothetical protein